MSARNRKRHALSDLRVVADELGIAVSRRKVGLSLADFRTLHAQVLVACAIDGQKRRAEDALARFCSDPLPPLLVATGGRGSASSAPVHIGNAPRRATAAAAPDADDDSDGLGALRLRSAACLFTLNNSRFADGNLGALWAAYLTFLRGLAFVAQWIATMERSLHFQDHGRVHLHCFVDFKKAVDWNSVEAMRFQNGLPHAYPTRARRRGGYQGGERSRTFLRVGMETQHRLCHVLGLCALAGLRCQRRVA